MEHLSSCLVVYREHMESLCLLNTNHNMQNSNEIKQKVSSSFNKEDGEVVNSLGKNREITEAGTDFYFSERVMSKSFLSFLLTHEFPCGLELMIILCLSKIYFVFCFCSIW